MSRSRDAEYTEYATARLPSLRELAAVLCDDWQRADDLVQATLLKLYVRWGRPWAALHPDAYARAVLVREFIHERRSAWVKRVSLGGRVADWPAAAGSTMMPCLTCGRRSRRCPPGSARRLCCAFTAT